MFRLRKQFIADLWFVFALLTPLFTPVVLIALTPSYQVYLPESVCALIEMCFTGPLGLLRASTGYSTDFISICALPTLFVAMHALGLRVMAASKKRAPETWRYASALGLLTATHLCIMMVGACTLGAVPSGGALMLLWSSSLVLYVVAASLWWLYKPIRAYGFELILGLMMMEHLAVPAISHLLFL